MTASLGRSYWTEEVLWGERLCREGSCRRSLSFRCLSVGEPLSRNIILFLVFVDNVFITVVSLRRVVGTFWFLVAWEGV